MSVNLKRKTLSILIIMTFFMSSLPLLMNNENIVQENKVEVPILEDLSIDKVKGLFQNVFDDLGIDNYTETYPSSDYNVLGKLRDNINAYQQVWTPWLSRGAIHVAKVSDDGEFLVVGGGYLLDTELHIYRWNFDERTYKKVWEAGSGIITRDVYDVAFGDTDNNQLIEIAAASADGRVYLFEQAHISDPFANLENRFDFVWRSDNFFQATSVEFSDLDLDGMEDLIVGSWDKKVHIFEYTDHSGYPYALSHWIELTEKWNSTELDEKIQSIAVGDFNGNGLPDFIVGTISGSVYVYENDGTILSPYDIEFPFPNDNDYRLIWDIFSNSTFKPIWEPIGGIAVGDLDGVEGDEAVLLAWGQGAWILQYNEVRGFYLEQLIRDYENWEEQGAYPLDYFADWMVKDNTLNWQVYYVHGNGSQYPEPWGFEAQNAFDIFANSAVTGEPDHAYASHGGVLFEGHEYKVFDSDLTWYQARKACEDMGGHLVSITSYEEEMFLLSLLNNGEFAWTALTDKDAEGSNKWFTGEYYAYEPPHIQHVTTEDYYLLYKDSRYYPEGYWRDAPYNWNVGYEPTSYWICEWDESNGVMWRGHEYKVITTPTSWLKAKTACDNMGGHLVTISDATENEYVRGLAASYLGTGTEIHIGYSDNEFFGGSEYNLSSPLGDWVWITGEADPYVRWNAGEPSGDGGLGDYGWMYLSDGDWNDFSGSDAYLRGYVCEWEERTWSSVYNGHEYKLFDYGMPYANAKAHCEMMDGHLVTISNAEENEFVRTVSRGTNPYIGYDDIAEEGNWTWVTDENVSYTKWYTSEPNNVGNEDAAVIYSNGFWNDVTIGSYRYFICEWDSARSKATTFYTNSTHQNATGTWNLGVGEELATNGNEDPDLYIIFAENAIVDPSEWNVSLGNNLFNFYTVEPEDIQQLDGYYGLAINVDPLFARKQMMSAQYIQLTLKHQNASVEKERLIHAIVHPYVARPITVAASVTIDSLSHSYNDPDDSNKVIFGCTDGRILSFKYDNTSELEYYKKFRTRPAEKWVISEDIFGFIYSDFTQEWDSFADDFYNLGDTIWSIQKTPKIADIPSWRYTKGESSELTLQGHSDPFHYFDVSSIPQYEGELIIASDIADDNLELYSTFDGTIYSGGNYFDDINTFYNGRLITALFAEIDSDNSYEEIIVFPWFGGANFINPTTLTSDIMPNFWSYNDGPMRFVTPTDFIDVDGYLFDYLSFATTYPSADAVDIDNDGDTDIILSNGKLVLLRNIGTPADPIWKFDTNYFQGLNEKAPPNPIYSPQMWDYDNDGDYDVAYSYGRTEDGSIRYGMDFFENIGTLNSPLWTRNAYLFKNPTTHGSFRYNNYTGGVINPIIPIEGDLTADSLWIFNYKSGLVLNLDATVDNHESFILGTNPELVKLEFDLQQDPDDTPSSINMGYSVTESWSTLLDIADWTMSLSTSYSLDGDSNAEIVVSDYDNNIYVFEHLIDNFYKRAFQSHNLNHTLTTDFSPYMFQEFEGISGTFQRTIYDHGNLVSAGLDYNTNGNEEFIVCAGLKMYMFESTGFNDEFELIYERDFINWTDSSITQFSSIAITPDFDGRGLMIALGIGNQLFLLRHDTRLGWLECFQPLTSGDGFRNIPGNPSYYSDLSINFLLFADINKDGQTELWVAGKNSTSNSGFLIALESSFGSIKYIYDFPPISECINVLTTTDKDYNGKLELVIGHTEGIELWEAEIGDDLIFTRTEVISSNPSYGISNELDAGFATYNSPTGLAAYAHDIIRLDNGDYFVVYGVEEENHDESGMFQLTDITTGDGRLYYTVTDDLSDLLPVKDPTRQLYQNSQNILISEVFHYTNDEQSHFDWLELYNPNDYDVNLTDWYLVINGTNTIPLSMTINASDYLVIANDNVVFNLSYTFFADLQLDIDLSTSDTLSIFDNTSRLNDHISWGNSTNWPIVANGTSSLARKSKSNAYGLKTIPMDTDSVYDWIDTDSIGTPGSGDFESTDDLGGIGVSIVEYAPTIIQLTNGSVLVSWLSKYRVNDGQLWDCKVVFTCLFDITGNRIRDVTRIDRIEGYAAQGNGYFETEFYDLGMVQANDTIFFCYSAENPTTAFSVLNVLKNGSQTRITDNTIGIDNFFIKSLDLVKVGSRVGIMFTGFDKTVFSTIDQLFFTSLNSSYEQQGVVQITSSSEQIQYPSALTMRGLGNIIVMFQYGEQDLALVYSNDRGITWSDVYMVNSNDPYLISDNTLTQGGSTVKLRQSYRPRLCEDGTGGITYQFVTRFLIENGSDPNYIGNEMTYSAADHNLVTQLWTSIIPYGDWFKFDNVKDVKSIVVGDSDNDLRSELFIAQDYQVTLLELIQSSDGRISYIQKWQYEPPSVVSLHPEILNSTFASYFAEDGLKRVIGDIAIFDANGNGWPELIFTVKGGDVFSFEIIDTDQPINDIYFLTEKDRYSNATLTPASNQLLITEVFYDPADNNERWIEIYNPSDSQISLNGLTITDGTLIISLSGTLNSKDFYILAQNETVFLLKYPSSSVDKEWSPIQFMHNLEDGGKLELKDGSTVIDSVSWGNVPPVNGKIEARGATLRRLSTIDTNSYLDWENTFSIGSPSSDEFYTKDSQAVDTLLLDINNDGILDQITADGKYGGGLFAWDLDTDEAIWRRAVSGRIQGMHLVDISTDDQIIVIVSTTGVLALHFDGSQYYQLSANLTDTHSNHILVDVTGDDYDDLIIATKNKIQAIDLVTGLKVWTDVDPDNSTVEYFDLAFGNVGGKLYVSVCSSDYISYKTVNILSITGDLAYTYEMTHLTIYDDRSMSVLGDFDGNYHLDLGIAIFDNFGNESRLEVINLVTQTLLINETIPISLGIDLSRFSIYTYDANNDSVEDIIVPIIDITSSNKFFPTKSYKSGIFAVNVAGSTVIWSRLFSEEIQKFKSLSYLDNVFFFISTANSEVFVVSQFGSDILYYEGIEEGTAFSIGMISDEIYVFITKDGSGPISKIFGTLSQGKNIITTHPSIINTQTTILYSVPDPVQPFVIPVVLTRDGTERLLIGFTNGTLILLSFDDNELWRIIVDPFTTISACVLNLGSSNLGLAIKTDTSDLFITKSISSTVVSQSSIPITNLTISLADFRALSLSSTKDVLLYQELTNISNSVRGTFVIYDPQTESIIWEKNNPTGYYTDFMIVSLDQSNPDMHTHIIALDTSGIVEIIELPSTNKPGGTFPNPIIGSKWISMKILKETNNLFEMFLTSDGGELERFSFISYESIIRYSYTISETDLIKIDAVDQGEYFNLLLTSESNGTKLFKEENGVLTHIHSFNNFHFDLLDHQFVNIDDDDQAEIIISMGNAINFFENDGDISESHSFTDNIISVNQWFIDITDKPVLVVVTDDGKLSFTDISQRILGEQNLEVIITDLRGSINDQVVSTGNSKPTENETSVINRSPNLILFYSTLILICVSLIIHKGNLFPKRRLNK